MKIRIALLFMSTAIFAGCKDKNNAFRNYYEKIPIVHLPLTINCGFGVSIPNDHPMSPSELRQFVPQPSNNTRIYGRIFENEKNIYICYGVPGDIIYPWLYTYTKEGKILDSLYLHIGSCAADQWLRMETSSVIHPDHTIEMNDTVQNFGIDTVLKKEFLISKILSKQIIKLDEQGIPKILITQTDTLFVRDNVKSIIHANNSW
jgi:hypothetical protein